MKDNRSIKKITGVVLAVLILFVFIPAASADGDITGDKDFMEIMEEIGHDLEHIHEDMHTVAFAMRVIAFSTAAIAGLLFLILVVLFMSYRKKA
jgi:hypothetical protein